MSDEMGFKYKRTSGGYVVYFADANGQEWRDADRTHYEANLWMHCNTKYEAKILAWKLNKSFKVVEEMHAQSRQAKESEMTVLPTKEKNDEHSS